MNAQSNQPLGFKEFIAMMALMMSLVALTIDAILPAFGFIQATFDISNPQDLQLIVSLQLLGLGLGQLFFGPISDSFGRKPIIYLGYLVFFIGCIICTQATSFEWLLVGRFIQGFGLAAPRVLAMAIIRDQYAGRSMAQIMSFIMVVFILVPMLAPILGQGILLVADWQVIFWAMLVVGIISLVWFGTRQRETLAPQDKKPFKFNVLVTTFIEVCRNKVAIGYTLTAGFISGAFITYLGSAQQIFQLGYELEQYFSFYFAGLALAIGLCSFFNGKLVIEKGMQYMVVRAIVTLLTCSVIFIVIAASWQGMPPLLWTTIYLVLAFGCIGVLFGNLNALAMETLGHLAGMGAAIVGSLATLLSAVIAIVAGKVLTNDMSGLGIIFALTAVVSGMIVFYIERDRATQVVG
ncbi:MAG: multidrug effflux MFS transporter [Gammaproteobacteria bacterium]|nr:multidrug effflux MFS transporter [Gammaproteobacteria bacterium]